MALNSIYTEKEDFAALGHMLSMLDHEFQLSCLALHDVFSVLAPLTLWLQTSPSKMDITVVNTFRHSGSPEIGIFSW